MQWMKEIEILLRNLNQNEENDRNKLTTNMW